MFNTPNLASYTPYELVFEDLGTNTDNTVSGTFKEYYILLKKRVQYLHKLPQDFRSKKLIMINKNRNFFQYSSGD